MKTLHERLYGRLIPAPDAACRLWTGCTNSRGYGVISVNGERKLVHRVAWELERGPIEDGLTIDHVRDRGCRHKLCAWVEHLEPVTSRVNTHRSLVQRGFRKYDPAYLERLRQLAAPAPMSAEDFIADLITAANRTAVRLGYPPVPVRRAASTQ